MSFADLKKLKKLPHLEANDRRHVLKSQAVAVRRGLQVVLSSFSYMYLSPRNGFLSPQLLQVVHVRAFHEGWDFEVSGCQSSQESDRYGAV